MYTPKFLLQSIFHPIYISLELLKATMLAILSQIIARWVIRLDRCKVSLFGLVCYVALALALKMPSSIIASSVISPHRPQRHYIS